MKVKKGGKETATGYVEEETTYKNLFTYEPRYQSLFALDCNSRSPASLLYIEGRADDGQRLS